MADVYPEFETTDDLGETRQFSGSVGTTAINIPSSPIRPIDAFLVRCPPQASIRRLEVSLNGGADWLTLAPSEYVIWSPKRDTLGNDIQQIKIRGNTASVLYEAILNLSNAP